MVSCKSQSFLVDFHDCTTGAQLILVRRSICKQTEESELGLRFLSPQVHGLTYLFLATAAVLRTRAQNGNLIALLEPTDALYSGGPALVSPVILPGSTFFDPL